MRLPCLNRRRCSALFLVLAVFLAGAGYLLRHRIKHLLGFRTPDENARLYGMRELPPGGSLTDVVDRYGQYAHDSWPGKVHSDSDLIQARLTEAEQLRMPASGEPRDIYGGWEAGPHFSATGFFRTARWRGRWWFIDPLGRLFLSMGVNGVTSADVYTATVTAGRERLFSWLPPQGDPLARYSGRAASAYLGGPERATYSFLRANIARKYGGVDPEARWRKTALQRLRRWGFDTLGGWSGSDVIGMRRMPYTISAAVDGGFSRIRVPDQVWEPVPDPYDPRFTEAAAQMAVRTAHVLHGDPWCLGVFVDNEISWAGPDDTAGNLARGVLAQDAAASPAKRAFLARLRSEYGDIAELNRAWGADYAGWSALDAPVGVSRAESERQAADLSACEGDFAARYFRTVAGALRARDPYHLYLGCRFSHASPPVIEAAMASCDVVSWNAYARRIDPETYPGIAASCKPVLVSEFHFGAKDRGLFSAGLIDAGSQAGRASAYRTFVAAALSLPTVVGCHWYMYEDYPVTGAIYDGQNGNVGLVSVTDTPYPELTAAATDSNGQAYALHLR